LRTTASRSRPTIAASLLALALGWLAGCAKSISDRDIRLVDVAEAVDLVAGRKVLFGLAGTEAGAFVDPRSERAYGEGHVPGAVNVPFKFVATRYESLRKYDVVVVYGDSYNDEVADGMSKRLLELGLNDVRTLKGGLQAWTSAGRTLNKGPDP